jgi:hypothetical protein
MPALYNATKKALIGRTIVAVEFNPFSDGRGGTAHDPRLTLDNGRCIYFSTEETDIGEYGICMMISERPRKSRARRRQGLKVLMGGKTKQ